MNLNYAVWSGKGCIRPGNEDNFYLNGIYNPLEQMDSETFQQGDTDAEEAVLLAVCDGMGGREAGERASEMAVSRLDELKERLMEDRDQESLRDWAISVNHAMCEEVPRSGSTLALLFVTEGSACAANIGDSRIYMLRNHELIQVSEDHSEVARLVRLGMITPEEARTHPDRHAINRHLGVMDDRHCEPQTYPSVSLQEGDVFLLCSDGVTDMVEDNVLRDLLDASGNAQAAAEAVYRRALENGGEDNTTAMVLCVNGENRVEEKEKKKLFSFFRSLFSRKDKA